MNSEGSPLSRFVGKWGLPILIAFVLVGAGLRLYVYSLRTVVDYDGVAYAQLGVNWISGEGYRETEGIYQWYYPPAYPLQIGLLWTALGNMETSARVVSLLYGLALPFALYYLGRRLFDPASALLAGCLAALYPRFIDISSAMLAESSFVFLYFATAAVGFLGIRKRSYGWLATASVLGALAYLTKPAATPLMGLLGLWLVGFALFERWGWKKGILSVAALSVPAIVISLPWVIHLHSFYGDWTLSELVSRNLYRMQMKMENDDPFKEYMLRDDNLEKRFHASPNVPPAERLSIPQVAATNPPAFARAYGDNFIAQMKHFLEGVAPLRWALFLGLFLSPVVFWREPEKRWAGLFCISMLAPLLVFPAVYISLRYTIPLQPFVLLAGTAGLMGLVVRFASGKERFIAALAAILLALAVFEVAGYTMRQATEREAFEPLEHKWAGEWILENYGPGVTILAYTPQLVYYAKGDSIVMPHATPEQVAIYARHKGARLVVIDERYIPQRRAPVTPLLDPVNAPDDFTVVYNEERLPGKRIVIYELPGDLSGGSEDAS